MEILRSEERGAASRYWLDSRHSFSFGEYHDPRWMGRGPLRVINEDWVAPGTGFPTHGHRDMEILTFVIEGALEHKDSLGTGSVIHPGEVQRMTAGTGIEHSEFNASKTDPLHLLQIWILPERKGLEPGYEQKQFKDLRKPGQLTLLASPDGHDGSLTIHQNTYLYVLDLEAGGSFEHAMPDGATGWVQMASGACMVNGQELKVGDGAYLDAETALRFAAREKSEILFFVFPQA